MQFDDNAISSFKQIINNELAYGIFLHDWAIRKEIENHLSIQLFQTSKGMETTLLKLLKHYIEKAKSKSIIGFTEDDPALTAIATKTVYEMTIPFYSYNLNDDGALSQWIKPEHVPCSLVIPYSSNDIQVNEIIKIFTEKMIPIKQVISLVEERPLEADFQKLNIEYVSLANWPSIKERIKAFRNIMPEKMASIQSLFKGI